MPPTRQTTVSPALLTPPYQTRRGLLMELEVIKTLIEVKPISSISLNSIGDELTNFDVSKKMTTHEGQRHSMC